MRIHNDPLNEPTVQRVVASGMSLYSDVPEEIALDLDDDGVDDIWITLITLITLITSVTTSPLAGLETATSLLVTARSEFGVGVSGPMQPGEAILRGDPFYRTVSLARFQGNARTEVFFGSWVRGPDEMAGILPVRLNGDHGVYLGYLALALDGYGNLTKLSQALSMEPMAQLEIPCSAMDMAPLPTLTIAENPPMRKDAPSTIPENWRIVLN